MEAHLSPADGGGERITGTAGQKRADQLGDLCYYPDEAGGFWNPGGAVNAVGSCQISRSFSRLILRDLRMGDDRLEDVFRPDRLDDRAATK